MEQGSFTYKTEKYYGSSRNIHTVSWKGRGEVDAQEILSWCTENFGNAGYQEELGESRWLDSTKEDTIYLCKDEDLTFFLLKWS